MGRGLSDLQKQILILANGYRKANDWDVATFKDDGSTLLPWEQPATGYYCTTTYTQDVKDLPSSGLDEYRQKLTAIYGCEPVEYDWHFRTWPHNHQDYYAYYFRSQRFDTLEESKQMEVRYKAEFRWDICHTETHQKFQERAVHLTPAHVLHEIFGFPIKHKSLHLIISRYRFENFDPDTIGRSKYGTARATTTRAFQRLEERKLVVRTWRVGIWITQAGADLADSLSANTSRISHVLTVSE